MCHAVPVMWLWRQLQWWLPCASARRDPYEQNDAVPVANAAPGPVGEHAAPDPYEQNYGFLMGLENHTAKELLKGNLRLVSALWLMQRPPGWTVQKLQDLPE